MNKKDPYAHLERFNLCNRTSSEKEVVNPYEAIERVRIASKRHFSGDTLKIEMTAQSLNESSAIIVSNKLGPNDCMDYYFDLTDTEKMRMSSIEILYIKVRFEGKTFCFTRDDNTGDFDAGQGKWVKRIEIYDL